MEYIEFSRASLRHYHTCQLLCDKMKSLSNTDENKKRLLMHNIYYLSGYVFETLLSYMLFSKLKWVGEIEISCHFKEQKFKTHNLYSKIMYAQQFHCDLSGIVFLDKKHSNKILQKMFNNWCVDLRYQESNTLKGFKFGEDDICEYVKEIGNVQKIILTKYAS